MMVKKKGKEKIKLINDYTNLVKELYRPVPSEVKNLEL